ncbi:1,4-alpha-glucan branching protein GlgB [Aliiglaciecola sp. CAU 1673]|uniref:1,4-alpha-glucan branching protein GlgB n=1 Tax=Aliiglaciecola sp. CAU 1673 TaxID=3032595 RepID=UPI0023DA3202|nr:1,4-alpha-glucan branching protein GlgB [Aliiglaciecola sp. CAU 1673]MDF2178760.1 1,4-alpha-glucan branching protein GlgB [Aliiglaciecola sp. CAU 1673]
MDTTSLRNAQCAEPFTLLGPFSDEQGQGIRAWLPGAGKVQAISLGTGKVLGTMQPHDDSALFVLYLKGKKAVGPYALEVTSNQGHQYQRIDPYQFQEEAFHAVHYVDHAPENLYRQLGAQVLALDIGLDKQVRGTRFAVFAPNASAVSLVGDFNWWDGSAHPMQKTSLGYWVLFVPGVEPGCKYKYQIKDRHGHSLPHKADPVGFYAEQYPSHASIVYDHQAYQWQDNAWRDKAMANKYNSPMSIYEVHLGSWRRKQDNQYLSYHELAEQLIPYVKDMGYTHVELLPISEYPFDGSWGYQPVGLFSPTSRFGNPDDFKYFVDQCHQAGIGVIIDWVPAHFPEDGHGLARFDGTHVYEYEDPRKGWHPDWDSCIYDFGKDTVRQFLVANALFWLDKFHIDGLRVDAVASMLYLDYSRDEGEWIPNVDGGNHNYEAISLLRWMNQEVYAKFPHAMTIAEESTAFAKVSRPVYENGLGFGFKWNMGWMHDSLHYISKDPAYRRYHHNEMTFSMVYAYDENFILPISHDEVVHGKGSLLRKMPGDEWQQAANHRCYAAFMYGHPGKKLNFMGNEIGQSGEWNHDSSVQWHLLDFDKHAGIQRLYRDLNHLYQSQPALHQCDHMPEGFRWLDHHNAEQSVLSFIRLSEGNRQKVYVVCNFTPVPQELFRLGVAEPGNYRLLLNTDDTAYWGSGYQVTENVKAEQVSWNEQPWSIVLRLPPLATLFILHEADE